MSMSIAQYLEDDIAAKSPNKYREPVFVTGFARSGTTWVNQILRDYCDVGMANEGNFIFSYGQRLRRYGNSLPVGLYQRVVRKLSQDPFFTILRRNYSVEIRWEKVLAAGPGFSDCVLEILTQVAGGMGKSRIGSKYPGFGWDLSLLTALFPGCSVVHVIRDGRDCALSHKAMAWGYQNTFTAASHWREYVRGVRRNVGVLHCRYHEVRYEDLLNAPEDAMRSLARFVGVSSEDRTARKFKAEFKRDEHGKHMVDRWRQELPLKQQSVFEAVAGDVLVESGYSVMGLGRSIPTVLRVAYMVQDQCVREFWRWARKVSKTIPERKRR